MSISLTLSECLKAGYPRFEDDLNDNLEEARSLLTEKDINCLKEEIENFSEIADSTVGTFADIDFEIGNSLEKAMEIDESSLPPPGTPLKTETQLMLEKDPEYQARIQADLEEFERELEDLFSDFPSSPEDLMDTSSD